MKKNDWNPIELWIAASQYRDGIPLEEIAASVHRSTHSVATKMSKEKVRRPADYLKKIRREAQTWSSNPEKRKVDN
jgi:hypothetical protein